MSLMNWKNNALVRIKHRDYTFPILRKRKINSKKKKKEKKTSPHHQTFPPSYRE